MDTEKVLHEATKFFERDENDPITTFAVDDYLTTVSISLPALILAVAIFLGGDMYSVDGLQVFNPNRFLGSSPPYKSYHFETWNQIPFLRKYCWAKLSSMDDCGLIIKSSESECGESQNLWHYAIVPKFLFLIIVLMYTTKIIWNTNVAKDLGNILSFIIGATEESIRDLVADLAKVTIPFNVRDDHPPICRMMALKKMFLQRMRAKTSSTFLTQKRSRRIQETNTNKRT